jgi:plasmid stabilization system protein ParE
VAGRKATVRLTANFEANLEQIAAYWMERDAAQTYMDVLDGIATVISNLEQHPRIGRSFYTRVAHSIEVRQRVAALLKRFGAIEVREYLSGDYLLLYSITIAADSRLPAVDLLAIRHHRQLSFNFSAFWQANRAGEER